MRKTGRGLVFSLALQCASRPRYHHAAMYGISFYKDVNVSPYQQKGADAGPCARAVEHSSEFSAYAVHEASRPTISIMNDVPGRQSFIIEMVGREDLMNGIALNSAVFNGARVVGPAIAGFLIGAAGIAACFYINGISYIAIIIMLGMMRIERPEEKPKPRPVFRELHEGLVYVRSTPVVLYFILMVAITSLFMIPYIALMPIFARDILHIGAKGLGIMMGFAGVGALIGALSLATYGGSGRKGFIAFFAAFVSALALLGFSLSREPLLSYALLIVVGWGMITQFATVNAAIQNEVPDVLRGRVMSLYVLVLLGFVPIGNLIIGALAHYAGTPHAVFAGAIVCLVTYAILMVFARKDLLTV